MSTACRAVRIYHARAIHAGKGVFTWHCAVSPRPAHSVRVRKGWKQCQQIRGCSRALCPNREERAHMTLCRHALPHQFRPSEAGAAFNDCRAVPFHPASFVRTGKSMVRPAARHIQSPRLLRGLCENSIQLFSRGSLASSGKDHFHNWKEQSCLSVRMDTSPSENLNFSAQLSIQERTRQAMCSVPVSKWYNGIAS